MSNFIIKRCNLDELNILDEFFASLKSDYYEFDKWLLTKTKLNHIAYSSIYDDKLVGLMILKIEYNIKPILKISTFKVTKNNHGIGREFLNRAYDYAKLNNLNYIYITIFDKYKNALSYFKNDGFIEYGYKPTKMGNGKINNERILVKFLDK